MFRCTKCYREIYSYSAPDSCPHCGVWFSGVRCESCGYTGTKYEFAGSRCPKCLNHVYIPYSGSTSSAGSAPSNPWTKNDLIWLWSVIAGIILLIAGFIWYSNYEPSAEKTISQVDSASNTFTDERDGHVYKTIRIGNQVLMAENFAYKPGNGNYWVYNNQSSFVDVFGYLYDWETANEIAPSGWHLPSKEEWEALRDSLGDQINRGAEDHIIGGVNNTFNAIMCGSRNPNGTFNENDATFWSSTPYGESKAWFFRLNSKETILKRSNRKYGFSVRLLKNLDN